MTVPTDFFGGNSDGGMRMESWLDVMCKGCVHGKVEGGVRDMGCDLPASAYADPYDDIAEWSADANPAGPMGLMCMKFQRKVSGKPNPRRVEKQGQLPLIPAEVMR